MQIMLFCTFEIALFSNFRALCAALIENLCPDFLHPTLFEVARYKRKKWDHFSARKSIKANIQYIYSMRKITAILCTCTDRSETQEDRHFLEVI